MKSNGCVLLHTLLLDTTQKIIALPHAVSRSRFHLVHLILNVKKFNLMQKSLEMYF